jgi:hypothetical protein
VSHVDSSDEWNDSSINHEDELEGFVDEEYSRSNEGYENLAPYDEHDDNYW